MVEVDIGKKLRSQIADGQTLGLGGMKQGFMRRNLSQKLGITLDPAVKSRIVEVNQVRQPEKIWLAQVFLQKIYQYLLINRGKKTEDVKLEKVGAISLISRDLSEVYLKAAYCTVSSLAFAASKRVEDEVALKVGLNSTDQQVVSDSILKISSKNLTQFGISDDKT